jgi:hypothetical protein
MRDGAILVRLIVVFLLGGIGGYVAHAQGDFRILGAGTVSCGGWLEEREKNSDVWIQMSDWVNGFLTGVQVGGQRPLTAEQTRDVAGRSAWLDNYCRSKPLDDLSSASAALFVELLRRK